MCKGLLNTKLAPMTINKWDRTRTQSFKIVLLDGKL